jgi:hypothetical protein
MSTAYKIKLANNSGIPNNNKIPNTHCTFSANE